MLIHPQFDPVMFALGPLTIRWYAMAYLLGFIIFLYFGKKQIEQKKTSIRNLEDFDALFFYGVWGVILGGRLGYVFFYNSSYYFSHLTDIIKIWEGGMSFHGGLIGVIIAIFIFAFRKNYRFLEISDFVVPFVPIGLGLGRLGNFINGELWGRVTHPNHFWAMGFPQAHETDLSQLSHLASIYQQAFTQFGSLPRHPSQLYEFALEGILLFLIIYLFTRQKRNTGQVSALFLISYGILRFLVEFSREPDSQLGLLNLGLSMGQWLCIPMIAAGVLICFYAIKKNKHLT